MIFMRGKSEDPVEPPADSGPDREGFSSRREFIRSLAAISAGLTVAAPLGRAANLTEKSIPKGAPPDPGEVQGWAEIKLQVNGNTERLVVDPRVTLLDALRSIGVTRHEERMRPRRLWGLHRASQRKARSLLFDARRHGTRQRGYNHRGLGQGR
jgi:hypothetical protein